MKRLTREAFDQARCFLLNRSRQLESTLFQHRFENAPAALALAELARFQNSDGGFGWGLEPDVRTPSSSALATAIGLRTLSELECSAEHSMVRRAVNYLLETFDQQSGVWRVVPTDTDSFPHAPWWDNSKGTLADVFDGFLMIPRTLLVSLLHHYASLVPADWLDRVTANTVGFIESLEVLGTGGGSDLEYAVHLAQEPNLPQPYARRLRERIRKDIPRVVVRDPALWGTYCVTPLRAVGSPWSPGAESPGADLIRNELQMHLDYQIAHQTHQGAWEPVWSWGEAYPEVWAQARLEWCGILTLDALTQLHAFGRIETHSTVGKRDA